MLCVTRSQTCSYGVLEFSYRHKLVARHLILFKKIQVFESQFDKKYFSFYDFVVAGLFT